VTQAQAKRRWTRDDNNLIAALYEQGVAPAQIAARTGIPTSTIETKLRAWGVPRVLRVRKRGAV